jgi:hypothetical protein
VFYDAPAVEEFLFGILLYSGCLFCPMGEPEDMEGKKTAFVKLILTVAAIDAAVIIFTLILPLVVMGEQGFTAALPLVCVPLVIGMVLSGGYFLYRMKKIDPY